VRLEPLYRVRFRYPEEWGVEGAAGTQEQFFFLAEGTVQGRLGGRFRGANHPQRRTDHTFVPDFQGVIETDDGATVFFDMHGYGRAYPVGRRQIVVAMTHQADDDRYVWLNDVLCVGEGEVRVAEDEEPAELVIDVAELVWEPIVE
jgi:Protein of unknown function (DUF3237)